MPNFNTRNGLKNNVTAVISDGELQAFKDFQRQHGGSTSAIAREAILLFLATNGYQPTTEYQCKKAS